ncbi:MAG TPA: DUF2007 domain-containing protein [Acidimicrobiia bacterium]|nr:DUF2007 domain-containing protein [Acidimicrobiia bacterium]
MPHHEDDQQSEDHDPKERYEPLTRISDPVAANILAAMLRSGGVSVRLNSESFGPYPVTVGGLAEVEVWVDADDLDTARAILEDYQRNA